MTDIEKAYEANKKWWFSIEGNNRFQLHHCFGRRGIWECCRQGFIGLTVEEHNSWKVLKMLREENLGLKQSVEEAYSRVGGCKGVNEKCSGCILLTEDVRK